MDVNPIFRSEMIRTARRARHYAMRTFVGLSLLFVAWSLYGAFGEPWLANRVGPAWAWTLRDLPWIADLLVLELIGTQGVAIILLVPGLVAGSIAEEDQRGTMAALLDSPLSSGSIVLGKLSARLAMVGVVLAVGLPVVVPLAILGAANPGIVARAYAVLIALAIFVGSLSMLVAVAILRPRPAMLSAYLAVGCWLLMPAWSAALTGRTIWPLSWLGAIAAGLLESHPLEAARNMWLVTIFGLFDPAGVAWAWSGLSKAFPRVVVLQLAGSALSLLAAARLLRPRRLGAWGRPANKQTATERPPVGDDPMLWKERHAHACLSRRAARMAIAALVLLPAGPLIEPATASFREWHASWRGVAASEWRRGTLNESLRQLDAGLYVIALAAVAAIAATSVTGERERATWTSLTLTFVTGREIARAKVSGASWAVRGLAIPFAILWGIGLATGSVHPLGVLAAAAGLVVFLRYAAALGVLFSTISPTSGQAIAATAAVLFAGNAVALLFVPLDLIGPLAGQWTTLYLAGVSPFVQWIALVSPLEIRWSLTGHSWESALGLPGGLWSTRILLVPGLIRIYLLSLLLHAVAASAALRAAAWAFDARHRAAMR
jgi:ABC-type transport system involved in multi-copper enzyme maturation permease subunit